MATQYRINLYLCKKQNDAIERIAKKQKCKPAVAARTLLNVALTYWDKFIKEQKEDYDG